ncbi:heterokaryon incompatibility protein-domain-containing protein [Xylaria telfairii]|nr:heterokaryon incompatibility protein-domain-containing protein [Xylaria telfairii]
MDQNCRSVYKSIQHDQVRLVKFSHHGSHTSAILQTFSLAGPIPPYYALSYTWLSDKSIGARNHVLQVGGKQFPVLDSLQYFFHVLSLKDTVFDDAWWWIDSICIDLANVEERGAQVQLMRRIYRNACKVVVWLGEGSDNTDQAIDFIEHLNNLIRQQIYSPEQIRSIFQNDRYHSNWAAVTEFFQRRWWTRIWTLQEYAMPESVSFWYGMRSVDRFAVEGALMAGDQCTGLTFKETPAFSQGFNRRRVQKLHDLGEKSGARPSRSLVALAAYSSCFEATDDRDRLYGIRALATDAFLLDVNYALDVEEIYLRFAKSFMEHYKSLDIICFASIYSPPPGSSLPSWVPDWRRRVNPLVAPLMVSQSARTHIGNLRPPVVMVEPSDPSPCYDATKNSRVVYEFEGARLLAYGTMIDMVDGLGGSRNTKLVQSSVLDTGQLPTCAESASLPSDVLKIVCKSLVLDRKDRFMRFSMPAEEFFRDFMWLCAQLITESTHLVRKEFREWYDWTKSLLIHGRSFESILRSTKKADIGPSSPAPNQDEYIMDVFFGRFFDTVVRRSLRLMVTSKGLIGLAPEKAMKGDLVCVLFGCSVPVLLRQSSGDETFILVGECFVDGFMEGEALKQDSFRERVFRIA